MIFDTLHDLLMVVRLQKQVEPLDLKGVLLRPASPLALAMTRRVPSFDTWSGRVLTVTVDHGENAGFVQARWRTGLPVLDLLCIAPALDAQHGAAWIWHDLLTELVRVGGARHVQRLFAHLPEARHAEIEVLRQAGFAIYAQDRLLKADALPRTLQANREWRPRTSRDVWGLTQLYHEITPPAVQQAERLHVSHSGAAAADDSVWTKYAGWLRSNRNAYVLPGETLGQVRGYLRLTEGEHGYWMKLVLAPEQMGRADTLLSQAMSLLPMAMTDPIYADLRSYNDGLLPALREAGFEELTQRILLVRHTTASLRIKAVVVNAAVQSVGETVPTTFCLDDVTAGRSLAKEDCFEQTTRRNHRRYRPVARHHATPCAGSVE